MSFMEKWDKAFESRDRDALSELLDDDFVFVRHQSGSEMTKEEMPLIYNNLHLISCSNSKNLFAGV